MRNVVVEDGISYVVDTLANGTVIKYPQVEIINENPVSDNKIEALEARLETAEQESVELRQQLSEANESNLTTMSALADVFEQVLLQQDQIAQLQSGTTGTGT